MFCKFGQHGQRSSRAVGQHGCRCGAVERKTYDAEAYLIVALPHGLTHGLGQRVDIILRMLAILIYFGVAVQSLAPAGICRNG